MNYINVQQLAEMLGVSKDIAYQLVHIDTFPAYRVSDRRIVVNADLLPEWLASNAAHPSVFSITN